MKFDIKGAEDGSHVEIVVTSGEHRILMGIYGPTEAAGIRRELARAVDDLDAHIMKGKQ